MKTESNVNTTAPQGVACTDGLGDYNPTLRCLQGNTWEASERIPVIGHVAVTGNGWQEARLKLWLVASAVEMMASKECKQPKDWTEDEWRTVMKTMRGVMSPNDKLTHGATP